MEIRFICDPSHGWGEVPISLIKEYGIASKISKYSYVKGDNAYLEEDCDLGLFMAELDKRAIPVKFVEQHSNFDSWVRNLSHWGK